MIFQNIIIVCNSGYQYTHTYMNIEQKTRGGVGNKRCVYFWCDWFREANSIFLIKQTKIFTFVRTCGVRSMVEGNEICLVILAPYQVNRLRCMLKICGAFSTYILFEARTPRLQLYKSYHFFVRSFIGGLNNISSRWLTGHICISCEHLTTLQQKTEKGNCLSLESKGEYLCWDPWMAHWCHLGVHTRGTVHATLACHQKSHQ